MTEHEKNRKAIESAINNGGVIHLSIFDYLHLAQVSAANPEGRLFGLPVMSSAALRPGQVVVLQRGKAQVYNLADLKPKEGEK